MPAGGGTRFSDRHIHVFRPRPLPPRGVGKNWTQGYPLNGNASTKSSGARVQTQSDLQGRRWMLSLACRRSFSVSALAITLPCPMSPSKVTSS
ncbi:hypothetical protein ACRRTK_009041 [Alexandromys fortis]